MPGFEEARRIVLEHAPPLRTEEAALLEASGRLLAEDLRAPWDMPQWDNSAMDGYAVRAAECAAAGAAGLSIAGFLPAGRAATAELAPHTAVRIMTGAPLPPGADAVLPFEDADERDRKVVARRQPLAGDHVRVRGGDMKTGETVLTAGTVLGPAEVSLLASLSRSFVPVFRRARVAIVSTGDELLAVGDPIAPGMIYDSNGPALVAATIGAGALPTLLPIARDDRDALRELLAQGLHADVLVTTAGVSVGDRDLVREVLRELGVEEVFWKVDIQPGRPTAFGLAPGTLVFSLPGNPVAALLTFQLFVRPALRRMMGRRDPLGSTVAVQLGEDVATRRDRVTLMRVRLDWRDGNPVASSAGRQATGFLRTLVTADAVAIIPADRGTIPAGTVVDAYPLRDDPPIAGR